MKNVFTIVLAFLSGVFACYGQTFRVYLKDKGGVEVSAENVALSTSALERRAIHAIDLDERDLPVFPFYLNELKKSGGTIEAYSRWFNYAVVDGIPEKEILELPFVRYIESLRSYTSSVAAHTSSVSTQEIEYGQAENQVSMLKGNVLHEYGYLGEGVSIAVVDGGFSGVESSTVFDSLWSGGRILGTFNFETRDTNIYQDGSHGSKVLSILGGYIDSLYTGSAPHANYWLLKSEVERSETPVEMDYWLMAAEYADSVGADIITSSLGYNVFENDEGNITYSELDGNTTVVTRAADMAARKGILVITSAGNEGGGVWKHITAPADGDSVLAVGAVDRNGNYAIFSGIGPTADGRIKPDVVAQGVATAFAANENVYTGNGTSFSCPVVAGLAACLWQVNPTKSNMEIFDEIRRSSDRWFEPNNRYGFGIPNFQHSFFSIGLAEILKSSAVKVYPNPLPDGEDKLNVSFEFPYEVDIHISVFDISGRELYRRDIRSQGPDIKVDFPFESGVYLLRLSIGTEILTFKILK